VWATACGAPAKESSEKCLTGGLAFYRKRTENLLRRYMRASLAVGRVPSVTEDITLRGRASSHHLKNFEDVVIFAIDVEKCLKTLEPRAFQLVVKIALQEYLLMEVAQQLRLDARTVARNYGRALDNLTAELFKKGLLDESGSDSCQEG
jgi:DNA-directed RNA polymerase specialized sigma24 family protein